METNFFNNIEGCELVEHIKKNNGHRFQMYLTGSLLAICAPLILISGLLLFKRISHDIFQFIFILLIILFVILCAIFGHKSLLSHNQKEKYILRFSDDIPAASLLKIEQYFDLLKEDKTGLWIATPKQKNK